MNGINVISDGDDDILNIPLDGNDGLSGINISSGRRRKAPKRKKRKIHQQHSPTFNPPPPPESIMEQDPTINAFINPTKKMEELEESEDEHMGDFNEGYGEDEIYEDEPQTHVESVPPSKGYTSVDDERVDLLNKFTRLDAKGVKMTQRFTAYSDIHEMRTEYQRLTYAAQLEASIKFQRKVLMAATTGLEFCNKRFNPFDVELDGWSENVMESMDEYDNIFEELYVKYRESVQVAPEIRLLMTLGGSAMMFHFTKTMFKAAMPSMQDVVKQNPDLVRNMVSAVANTAQQRSNPEPQQGPPQTPGGRREMRGPDMDMSNLFSSLMPQMGAPPPILEEMPHPSQINIQDPMDNDDIDSLISSVESVSLNNDFKEIKTGPERKKRKYTKKKKDDVKTVEL